MAALWANTEAAPYIDLFNDGPSATKVWRSVLIMRAVDQELQKLKNSADFSSDFIAVHFNRLILHLVFNDDALRALAS
jgi:hypothetical protein